MKTITQLDETVQALLGNKADAMAKTTGFIQRQRKLTGSQFLQASVWGWLQHPSATRQQLHQTLLQTGVKMSAPGYEARFNERAAVFLRAMVAEAVQEVFETETLPAVVERFSGVYVTDSTRVETGTIGLKVAARLELQRGALQLSLETLERHDNACQVVDLPLPRGALHLGDLGFFDLKRFARWAQNGVEWVTRYKVNAHLYDPQGQRLSLENHLSQTSKHLRLPVLVGQDHLPMTLVAQRVSEAQYQQRCEKLHHVARRKARPVSPARLKWARWTIYLTSVDDLTFDQVHTLYRARWQIERLFKRWKSLGNLTTSSTLNPIRRTCEVYAKLFAVLLAHWLTQAHAWSHDFVSLDKVFRTLQTHATLFFLAWFRFPFLSPVLDVLFLAAQPAHTLSRRKAHPGTRQLLLLFDALP